jgi:hypothetical protein
MVLQHCETLVTCFHPNAFLTGFETYHDTVVTVSQTCDKLLRFTYTVNVTVLSLQGVEDAQKIKIVVNKLF